MMGKVALRGRSRIIATDRRAHKPRVHRQAWRVERCTMVHALTAQPARRRYRTLYDVTPSKHISEVIAP